MASFYQFIAVNNEVLKFEFVEVFNPSCSKYFVQVFRGNELVTSFEMKYNYSRWDIVPPAPEWAPEVRMQLNGVIQKFREQT